MRVLRAKFSGTAALAIMLLAACGPTVEPPAMDYAQRFPVGVQVETVAMVLPLTAPDAPFAAEDEARIARLAGGFIDRGHGALTLVAPVEPVALRERLVAQGVPLDAIRSVRAPTGSTASVTARYERYVATLPACGHWSGNAGRNPLNDVHPNFGCASQNNLGVMAADPADLVRMRDPAPTDAQNSNRVVRRYRAGEPPAAVPTPLQSSGAAGTTSIR